MKDRSAERMVRLEPMSEVQFRAYREWAVPNFAQESARAGNVPHSDALAAARRVFSQLLPRGLATKDQHLFTIVDEPQGIPIGYLWYGIRRDRGQGVAALYELLIYEPFRRQGYGAAALKALEVKVTEAGFDRIVLHVFGHNEPARALYGKVGYRVTSDAGANVVMAKQLGGV